MEGFTASLRGDVPVARRSDRTVLKDPLWIRREVGTPPETRCEYIPVRSGSTSCLARSQEEYPPLTELCGPEKTGIRRFR